MFMGLKCAPYYLLFSKYIFFRLPEIDQTIRSNHSTEEVVFIFAASAYHILKGDSKQVQTNF